MTGTPQPYSEKIRLGEIISDARELLAQRVYGEDPGAGWAARCGELEAMLKMLADSAEIVAGS